MKLQDFDFRIWSKTDKCYVPFAFVGYPKNKDLL